MEFSDIEFGTKFRDRILRWIRAEIERLRPAPRYARVVSIDRPNRTAYVRFHDHGDPVRVAMGAVQPSTTNQIVRVESYGSDYFISDVMGPAHYL